MRIPLLLFGLIAVASSLNAQQFREVTCGPNYTLSTYFKFGNQESISLEHNAWDIAFTAQGLQDAGIFLNEAAGLDGTELELYLIPVLNSPTISTSRNWANGSSMMKPTGPTEALSTKCATPAIRWTMAGGNTIRPRSLSRGKPFLCSNCAMRLSKNWKSSAWMVLPTTSAMRI